MADKTLPPGYTAKGLQDTTPEELDAMIEYREVKGMKVKPVWEYVDPNEDSENGVAELNAVKFDGERWFDLSVWTPGMGTAVVSLSERDALALAAAIVKRVSKNAQTATNYS